MAHGFVRKKNLALTEAVFFLIFRISYIISSFSPIFDLKSRNAVFIDFYPIMQL